MPNYAFDKFLGVTLKSEPQPLAGQKHRSSKNYDFRVLQKGSRLKWKCTPGISFDVKLDVVGTDPIIFSGITNETITEFPADNKLNGLYIADPKFATSDFEVQVHVEP